MYPKTETNNKNLYRELLYKLRYRFLFTIDYLDYLLLKNFLFFII